MVKLPSGAFSGLRDKLISLGQLSPIFFGFRAMASGFIPSAQGRLLGPDDGSHAETECMLGGLFSDHVLLKARKFL